MKMFHRTNIADRHWRRFSTGLRQRNAFPEIRKRSSSAVFRPVKYWGGTLLLFYSRICIYCHFYDLWYLF